MYVSFIFPPSPSSFPAFSLLNIYIYLVFVVVVVVVSGDDNAG